MSTLRASLVAIFGLLNKGVSIFEFWRLVIQQLNFFTPLHVILQCTLALTPTSCEAIRRLRFFHRCCQETDSGQVQYWDCEGGGPLA